jgi:hypothetical protein
MIKRIALAGIMAAQGASVALGQASSDQIVDLSHVPQISETPRQRDERLQWFRDAKLGMMICWGPSSLGECEIGWSRAAARPWDIGKPNNDRKRTEDPVYDNYYQDVVMSVRKLA